MNLNIKFWRYNSDKVGLYLSIFFILLFGLLFYLKEIDNDINGYDKYNKTIEEIKDLNYKVDRYFTNPYKYIDYDKSNQIKRDIQTKINSLKDCDFISLVGKDVEHYIDKLQKVFVQKSNYLEDFKTLNARATNSLHYLFDLRKNLDSKLDDASDIKVLVDRIFFALGQILMDVPYDKLYLQTELKSLEQYKVNLPVLQYFIQHIKQFLKDQNDISSISSKALVLPIEQILNRLLYKVEISYQHSREWQNIIAFIFFVFAFLILVMLIVSFRKIRRNSLELKAFRFAIENSDNSIIVTDQDRRIIYVNDTFEQRTGYSKGDMFGKNPNILKSGLVTQDVYIDMNKALTQGKTWQGELINRKKDGSLIYEKSSIVPILINNEIKQYIGIKLDITEYKEQESRLKQASIVYESMGDGILITDKDKKIIDLNPAFEEMFGYSRDELIGKTPMFIKTQKEDKVFYENMWSQLKDINRWTGRVYNKTKDGKIIPIWLTISLVKDENNKIQNYIGIYTDLSEIIASQEKAEYLAYHDSLTSLPNRAYLDLHLQDMIELADKTHQQLAVLFLDLDRFKIINDTLGHSVGDAMLIEIGQRIRNLIDKDILFARIGGDEFVIVILHPKAKQKATELAQRVLEVVRKPIKAYSYHLNTSASIGISLYPDNAKDKQELLQYADAAMYAAKENGKDNYQLYNTRLSLEVKDRLNIEQELSNALRNKEFYLYYQPQYDLQKGKIVGIEALLRWENKNLGLVSPDEFVEIAEETGIIVSVGYYVIEEACKTYMRLKKYGYELDSISVNVATIQFREDDFVEKIKEIFTKTGISPSNVEIEITERFIIEFSIQKLSIIQELRDLGCRISIDDFGTGYSSMNYLKKLPLDTIKIDKSFVSDIPSNPHDIVVTKAIIALSKNLGYQVIAEGIETQEQEEFLKENGCDIGQGYYFAKPMSEDDLIEFLNSQG